MKPGALWPWVIGGALVLHVVVSLGVVFFATSDASYAVEEDYYQKAIDWDQKRAQDRTNERSRLVADLFEPTPPSDARRAADARGPPDGCQWGSLWPAPRSLSRPFTRPAATTSSASRSKPTEEAGLYTASPADAAATASGSCASPSIEEETHFTHTETRHLFVEGSW